MREIDDSNAVGTKPTPDAPGTIGFFQQTATTKTKVTADWLNQVQGELIEFLTQRSITPSKTATDQVYLAVIDMLQSTTTPVNPFMNYSVFVDEKASPTNAQTFAVGWNQLDLNTLLIDHITGASVSGATNRISLPIGKYRIKTTTSTSSITSAASQVGQCEIRNFTDAGALLAYGLATTDGEGVNTPDPHIIGEFELTAPSEIYMNQYSYVAFVKQYSAEQGNPSIYTQVEIWKLD